MWTLNRAIILAHNEGWCCGIVQAASREPDHGGRSLVQGFFVMGCVHIGVSPVTSGLPCIIIPPAVRNHSFTYNRRHISLATGSVVQ